MLRITLDNDSMIQLDPEAGSEIDARLDAACVQLRERFASKMLWGRNAMGDLVAVPTNRIVVVVVSV